jgi:hypothetical protein
MQGERKGRENYCCGQILPVWQNMLGLRSEKRAAAAFGKNVEL